MKQPIVAFFGGTFSEEEKTQIEATCEPFYFENDQDLEKVVFDHKPDVLVSVGNSYTPFQKLLKLPLRERKKWLHYQSGSEVATKMSQLHFCFVSSVINRNKGEDLITVFTTSYKSGDYILRPFNSLRNQTYQNWEWVIFDDTDGDENFETLKRLKAQDHRIRIYKADGNSGIIGNVKNLASGLARGEILIEVDHDDDLTPWALEKTYEAFKEFPEAGFAYSDFTEIFEDGRNFAYSELFAIGYGAYRKEFYQNRWRNVCCCPPINSLTIRYIVSSPNHLRAWRKSTLQKIGGWNPYLHVADDYECMLRTFLETKMVRIPYLCYLQYRNAGGNNYTFIRNAEIQKLVRVLSNFYDKKIHDRIEEMGEVDEYYEDWKDWPKFGKSWLNSSYEKRFNEISHLNPDLVSVVLVADTETNQATFQLKVNQALSQYYPSKEVVVIGSKCEWLESALDSSNNTDLKWWNLETGTLTDAINYAVKMVTLGGIIAYETDDLSDPNYLNKVCYQVKDSETGWSENQLAHRASLFEQVGYWSNETNSFYEHWAKYNKEEPEHNKEDQEVAPVSGTGPEGPTGEFITINDGPAEDLSGLLGNEELLVPYE